MGKNGKKVFENSLKDWDLEYTEKKSLTNKDSFLLNIKKIKKKIKRKLNANYFCYKSKGWGRQNNNRDQSCCRFISTTKKNISNRSWIHREMQQQDLDLSKYGKF